MDINEIIGKQFERYTVLRGAEDHITLSGRHCQKAFCRCLCGTEKEVFVADLISGKTKSCGCYTKDRNHDTMIDLTGQQFDRLTVIREDGRDNAGIVLWLCQCICGNYVRVTAARLTSGNTCSCGCLQKDRAGLNNFKDLTGMRFGHLIVLYRDTTAPKGKGAYWVCLCDCGGIKTIRGKDLLSGHNITCGCGIGLDHHRLNLVGRQFGELKVIAFAGIKNNQTQWLCRCSCGRETVVSVGCLTSGNTRSCGCIVSRGEHHIAQFLDAHNIIYYTQKKFIGCCDIAPLKFDFWLPEYLTCIEFDGIQHFEVSKNWNDTEEGLRDRQNKDAIKDKYCEENDITLIRIPYWEKDNIESILIDWLFLNDADEANSSDVDLSA